MSPKIAIFKFLYSLKENHKRNFQKLDRIQKIAAYSGKLTNNFRKQIKYVPGICETIFFIYFSKRSKNDYFEKSDFFAFSMSLIFILSRSVHNCLSVFFESYVVSAYRHTFPLTFQDRSSTCGSAWNPRYFKNKKKCFAKNEKKWKWKRAKVFWRDTAMFAKGIAQANTVEYNGEGREASTA